MSVLEQFAESSLEVLFKGVNLSLKRMTQSPQNTQFLKSLEKAHLQEVYRNQSPTKLLKKQEIVAMAALSFFSALLLYTEASNCQFKNRIAMASFFISTSGYAILQLGLNILMHRQIHKDILRWEKILEKRGYDLKDLPKHLWDQKSLILKAIKNEPHAIVHAPLFFKYDEDIQKIILETDSAALRHLPFYKNEDGRLLDVHID